MLDSLRLAYIKYDMTLEQLESLYGQDKWGEFSGNSLEVSESGKFLLRYAKSTLATIVKKMRRIWKTLNHKGPDIQQKAQHVLRPHIVQRHHHHQVPQEEKLQLKRRQPDNKQNLIE